MNKRYVLLLAAFLGITLMQAQTLSQARELFNQGKYAEALPAFQRLVKQSPSNANYNYWYGACCVETGADSLATPYLEKAAKRKVLDAYPYLTRAQMAQYLYDEAVETCEDYIKLLTAKKKETTDAETALARARMASLMLRGTERVCVIDSFVVDKDNFLSAYNIGKECGSVVLADRNIFYQNELGQKRYWALPKGKHIGLFTSDKLLDEWTAPKAVEGLSEDGDNSYPYLLGDGTTLYYANNGSESLGGYDIFVTRFNTETGKFLKAENLGMPYNSPANDYMMVIDEFNNLGWFASDRYQPEGKVCIYVFVPNASRETFDYENDGEELIVRRAKLSSIRDTWTDEDVVRQARQRLAMLVHDRPTQTERPDFTFLIDDRTVYHKLADFRSREAQTLFRQWQQMQKDYLTLSQQLDGLRTRYASSPEASRQTLAPQILDLEKRKEQMSNELDELEVKARNTEKNQLDR